MEWLKVKALSSNPSITKNKKKVRMGRLLIAYNISILILNISNVFHLKDSHDFPKYILPFYDFVFI
jgi:hypothetical protein